MKIKIKCDECNGKGTIKRECCQGGDLKVVQPVKSGSYTNVYFCVHCGKRWRYETYTDAAGSMDYELKPIQE
jgi:DnaJ-class molecular chaperone